VVTAIGLADSLNPSTVAPAVYLAISPRPVRRIVEFAAGVFTVSLAGGILLLLGPGQLLLSALPHPSRHTRHLILIGAGLVLLAVAAAIWLSRARLGRRSPPGTKGGGRSTFLAGATLMLAELPTAFPYFGAIAVIVGSRASLPAQVAMVVLFNVLFVAPLVLIAVLLGAVPRSRSRIEPAAAWLAHHWPAVFACIALVLGFALAASGVIGLARE
jgi:cytochrome c biogenesis protein CcdA